MVDSPASGHDDAGMSEPVVLPASVLDPYDRFTLFNSPYPAHTRGCAVDLYPRSDTGVSPVAGEVLDTRTVRCPSRHYAVDTDHLILVAVDDGWAGGRNGPDDLVARILHVDPAVEPGDRVAVGDSLGELVRSGFFGRWVDNHVHLGFRPAGANAYRATGSLPVAVDVDVGGLPWNGRGTVVETGPTHALLDRPAHPAPGDAWATVAADDGRPLDGGLVHYPGGGVLDGTFADDAPGDAADDAAGDAADDAAGDDADEEAGDDAGDDADADAVTDADDGEAALSLLGTTIGRAVGRHVDWTDVAVLANGRRATGLSLFAARDDFGAKLVFHEGHDFAVGDEVSVEIQPTEDPIILG